MLKELQNQTLRNKNNIFEFSIVIFITEEFDIFFILLLASIVVVVVVDVVVDVINLYIYFKYPFENLGQNARVLYISSLIQELASIYSSD